MHTHTVCVHVHWFTPGQKHLLKTNTGLPGWQGIGQSALLHWPWVMAVISLLAKPHSWTLIWATFIFSWSQISKTRTLIHLQTEPDCVHSFKLPFHQNLKLNSFWGDMNTMAVLGSEELLKFMTLTAVLESPWNFLQKESLIFLWFQVWIRFKWWGVDRWRTSLDWSWYKPGHVRYKKFPSILCTMT